MEDPGIIQRLVEKNEGLMKQVERLIEINGNLGLKFDKLSEAYHSDMAKVKLISLAVCSVFGVIAIYNGVTC